MILTKLALQHKKDMDLLDQVQSRATQIIRGLELEGWSTFPLKREAERAGVVVVVAAWRR